MKAALDLRAIATLVVLCASWGLNQVAIKVAVAGIPPALQMGARSFLAAILVGAWCLFTGKRLFRKDATLWPGLLVGALFAAEFYVLFEGLRLTTASRAVVFLYLAPFVVAVGGHFALGERLGMQKLLGLGCAFLGLITAFSDKLSLPSPDALVGDMLCVLAAIFWGLTIVLVKGTSLAKASAEKTLLYQLAISAVLGLALAAALGEPIPTSLSAPVAAAFLYQAIWVAAITYVAWFALIRIYPASLLSSFTFLTPLFGVAFGGVLLDDPLSPLLFAALLLVAGGIYLVSRSPAAPLRVAAGEGDAR